MNMSTDILKALLEKEYYNSVDEMIFYSVGYKSLGKKSHAMRSQLGLSLLQYRAHVTTILATGGASTCSWH